MGHYVEIETGTSHGRVHPHNGYYAGDFSDRPVAPLELPQPASRPR